MKGIFCQSLLLLLLYFATIKVFTQSVPHAIFLELGGMAPEYSLNYEYLFPSEKTLGVTIRAGLGVSGARLAVPLGIGVVSTDAPHRFQVVAGLTPYIKDYGKDNSDTFVDIVISTGYRYQEEEARWFATIGMFPKIRLDPAESDVFDVDPKFKFAIGIAGGWRF